MESGLRCGCFAKHIDVRYWLSLFPIVVSVSMFYMHNPLHGCNMCIYFTIFYWRHKSISHLYVLEPMLKTDAH